ncbi:MAG: amino acid adenylation domain-containing protein [Terriglobales bacterium]
MTPYLLPQAFAAACARWPEQAAVIGADGTAMSYAELERRSRRLAAGLLAAGAGAGAPVGVWMAKSPAAVVGLLAVLRAGCIYVPLDPWAPAGRIEALASDCGLALLLSDAAGVAAARLWARPPAQVWNLEEQEDGKAAMPLRAQPPAATGDDVAYVLYTSGSTGVPKGVMLTHAHALNFIRWAGQEAGLRPGDRVASHAPFHFDLSIFDLWASLSHGATVCLLDPVTARFPRAVAAWVQQLGITVWYSVPSALVSLEPDAGRMAKTLRVVAFAGEVFPPATLRAWREAAPEAVFHNWYGPTETNVCAHYCLPAAGRGGAAVVDPLPIGRACPNFELAVGDEEAEAVGGGNAGFLWARGPGILAGYWGDEERTRAVTRLRAGAGGRRERWYNTGDLVRRDERGELFYLGRRDALIKCRGYRISLLEVEAALQACAGVRRAVVLAVPEQLPAGLRAYVEVRQGVDLEAAALRRWLSERLPGYMVPEAFVMLAQLPQTGNGKIDRQKLQQAAAQARSAAAREACAPAQAD